MTDLQISRRGAIELLSHESAVLEAYKDSVGVWTWGVGITNASGHEVYPRYRSAPQSLEKVLEVFLWALKRYEDQVIKAFHPIKLNEHQLAAAVSFHYNTGGINKASWVRKFKAGDVAGAKKSFMAWSKPKEIIPRRRKERDLFFDGKWSGATKIVIWGVYKNGNVNWRDKRTVGAKSAIDAAWSDSVPKPAPPKPKPSIDKTIPPKKGPLVAFIAALISMFKGK